MRVIKKNITTGEEIECDYPRIDREPVVGDTTYDYFFIEQAKQPEYDDNKYNLLSTQLLDKKTMVCKRGWELVEKPKDEIINRLNNSLSMHLDTFYPIWKRVKQLEEIMDTSTTKERKDAIKVLKDWEKRCRAERDKRELEFIKNNVLPSFEFEKP